jgi:hypothetical protein
MFEINVTRRAALGGVAAMVLVSAFGANGALARPRALAGGIHVDVTPLLENSGEPTAGWVARQMPGALARAGVGGPVSVRIDYVLLGPSSGGAGPLGSSPDQIIGVAIAQGVERPIRATANYFPLAIDQTLVEQSNFDRVSRLVQAFAYWVAREG